MKRILAATTCVAATLLASLLTGCSSNSPSASSPAAGSSGGGDAATAAAVANSTPAQATVATKSSGKLGTILVDAKGRTLYLFLADKKNKSTCTGSCAAAWPPLLTAGSAKPGQGADKTLLGTAQRSGGAKQVSYNGHPLYYYIGDTKPGQTNGQGLNQFGALWYVLNAKGKQVTS